MPGGGEDLQAADTSRPALPEDRFLAPGDTLAYPLAHVSPDLIYYRTVLGVLFDTLATGERVREVLSTHRAEVIAGTPLGAYVVRVPDLGPDPERLLLLVRQIAATPGVKLAYPFAYWRGIRRGSRDSP